jgi:hypothetical protein
LVSTMCGIDRLEKTSGLLAYTVTMDGEMLAVA